MSTGMRVGILGGGQLALMLAQAGHRIGIEAVVYDPTEDACAQTVCPVMHSAFDDVGSLTEFANSVDVVTCEFENVPMTALEVCAKVVPIRPGPSSFFIARNRVREKAALQDAGWTTADFVEIRTEDDLKISADSIGFPCVLKSAEGGYDGHGQRVVRSMDELKLAWHQMGVAQLIAEKLVGFTRELSIIGCRARDGTYVTWPIVQNHHEEGTLLWSVAPAPNVNTLRASEASILLISLMKQLNHVGVLTLEMFDTPGGLVANEIAPRVHNSGHWSIEGCSVSQFENHMRAVTGRHLVIPETESTSVMVNLLGFAPPIERMRSIEMSHVHLYGKSPRSRRKIGHFTSLCSSAEESAQRLDAMLSVIRPNMYSQS